MEYGGITNGARIRVVFMTQKREVFIISQGEKIMLSKIHTAGLMGIDGFAVQVQTDISNGMPAIDIIGLPGMTIKESKERAKTSIKNSGFTLPQKRITINMAPASTHKEGSHYDLPITVSVLNASGQLIVPDTEHTAFIGELALDGSVLSVMGVLPMVIALFTRGFTKFFVPEENADEAAIVEGAEVYPVKNLREIADHFYGIKFIERRSADISAINTEAQKFMIDLSDVKGQSQAKRALEIAASGSHNILFRGAAGTGKSMLAKRLCTILPDMTFDEMLEVTKIHSIAGLLPEKSPLVASRPFRSPHHTVSPAALSGGGSVPKPGELSLAHNGVLFLDELPEFNRDALEVLRQPLEDGRVTISRVNATLTYPCNIMLVCAMNPCKCGNYGNKKRVCTCTPREIERYQNKVSGPLLDRIDIQVDVPAIDYDDLKNVKKGETSAEVRKRVNKARKIQTERYKDIDGINSNAQLTAPLLQEFCRLDEQADTLLKQAFNALGLSARAHSKILKVARTIADLEGRENITVDHVAEAIQYRNMDRMR